MNKKDASKVKITVIIGYILVVIVLIGGLFALYRNLVDYSDKKVKSDDLTEIIIVGNTITLLYEVESEQNLLTSSSALQYLIKYDSIIPIIEKNLQELRILSADSLRNVKLDSISLLVNIKRDNLKEVISLLDSIRVGPQIVTETHSVFESKLDNKSDTTIISKERKNFFERLRDVFVSSPDSTVIIENIVVDTVVNKVRYSERLDMSRQLELQSVLFDKQLVLSNTNRMLTVRIDELLKNIEQEEITKSIKNLEEKEYAIFRSQRIMLVVFAITIIIILIFAFLFLIDINKSQRYRRELEKSNQQISELLTSRQKLMLTISHDIKAPMSSISGFIELLKDGFSTGISKEKSIEYLHNMSSSANHIMQLVTTLLDFSKLQEGKWEFKNRQFNLQTLVDDVTTSFRPIAEKKGLKYYVESNLTINKLCLGDPYVLRQIVSNLISNAIKYTYQGEIVITIKEFKEIFYFSISDTGIGIDTKDQESIFDEFKQVSHENVYGDGSGLGLAITKRLINELEGKIYLTSQKGVGSEFTIKIPLKTINSLAVVPKNNNKKVLQNLKEILVFILEDDPIQLKMVTEMILKKGAKCIGVSDTENVVPILMNNKFDILFIDINLHETTGIELIKYIYERDSDLVKDIPIIALSAASDITKAELKSHGFTDFLPKPFTSNDLFNIMEMHINQLKYIDENKKDSTSGLMSLIDYVKDDSELSCEILQTFISETTSSNKLLEVAFKQNDYTSVQKITHKMLPIIRLIGQNEVITIVEQLEKGNQLSKDMEKFIIVEMDRYITEAKALKDIIGTRIDEYN